MFVNQNLFVFMTPHLHITSAGTAERYFKFGAGEEGEGEGERGLTLENRGPPRHF